MLLILINYIFYNEKFNIIKNIIFLNTYKIIKLQLLIEQMLENKLITNSRLTISLNLPPITKLTICNTELYLIFKPLKKVKVKNSSIAVN